MYLMAKWRVVRWPVKTEKLYSRVQVVWRLICSPLDRIPHALKFPLFLCEPTLTVLKGASLQILRTLAWARVPVSPASQPWKLRFPGYRSHCRQHGCSLQWLQGLSRGTKCTSSGSRPGYVDVVILALGLDGTLEGEGSDRMNISLPGQQEELALAVIATGKPVVVLLFNGGTTISIESLKDRSNVAITECFYPEATGMQHFRKTVTLDSKEVVWPRQRQH